MGQLRGSVGTIGKKDSQHEIETSLKEEVSFSVMLSNASPLLEQLVCFGCLLSSYSRMFL